RWPPAPSRVRRPSALFSHDQFLRPSLRLVLDLSPRLSRSAGGESLPFHHGGTSSDRTPSRLGKWSLLFRPCCYIRLLTPSFSLGSARSAVLHAALAV